MRLFLRLAPLAAALLLVIIPAHAQAERIGALALAGLVVLLGAAVVWRVLAAIKKGDGW